MFSSEPKLLFSSSRTMKEGWRESTLLMVSTGDEPVEANELRELLLPDEADEARRKEVRMPAGENRERMVWKREVCILDEFAVTDRRLRRRVSVRESGGGPGLLTSPGVSGDLVRGCGSVDSSLSRRVMRNDGSLSVKRVCVL